RHTRSKRDWSSDVCSSDLAGAVVSFLFSLGLQSIGFFADQHNAVAAMAGLGIGSAVFIVLVPLFIVVGLFIGSAIVHLCLMIVEIGRASCRERLCVVGGAG